MVYKWYWSSEYKLWKIICINFCFILNFIFYNIIFSRYFLLWQDLDTFLGLILSLRIKIKRSFAEFSPPFDLPTLCSITSFVFFIFIFHIFSLSIHLITVISYTNFILSVYVIHYFNSFISKGLLKMYKFIHGFFFLKYLYSLIW